MDVVVPDLGDFSDVEVIEVFVKAGDSVSAEDPLITLETDKAAMDVPSPAAGVVKEIRIAVGDRISSGDVIAELEAADAENGAASRAGGEAAEAESGRASDGGGEAAEDESGCASDGGGEAAEDESGAASDGGGEAAEAESGAASDGGGESERAREPHEADKGDGAPETGGGAQAAPAPAASSAGEPRPVTVPDLGDFGEVEIIEVLVAEGDSVEAEQGLVTLETEKAAMDVPSPAAGRILELKVEVGSHVSSGTEIAVLEPAAADAEGGGEPDSGGEPARGDGGPQAAEAESAREPPAKPAAAGSARPPREDSGTVRSMPPIDERSFSTAHASPSVRKLARELGVDLGRVDGSGRKGRVTADDVKAYVKRVLTEGGAGGVAWPEVPEVDFAKHGEVEVKPLSRIQKIAGPRLHASWVNLPHVTQHDEADITDLENTRQGLKGQAAERGIKLTPLAFILRALALTLGEFERLKSSLAPDGEHLVIKKYMHIGFAADTPNGLVVPVIRDADRMDVYELATALGDLSERAREGKLKAADMQGGVFTVSSLGGIGGTFFTPIIVAPEVAILGVSKAQWKPVWNGSEFAPRLMLPLSLSYDHRVIDGAEAVRFTTRLAETLGDVERILEAIP